MKKKGMITLAAMIMMLLFASTAVFGFNWGVCDKCGDTYDDRETNCSEKLEAANTKAAKKKEKARDKALDAAEKKYKKCVGKAWNKFGKCCAKKMKGKYQKGKSARDLKDEMESIEKWTKNLRNACHQKYGEKCADKCGDDYTDELRPCFEKCIEKENACLEQAKKREPQKVNDAYKRVFVVK